jgi:hypothetical protein
VSEDQEVKSARLARLEEAINKYAEEFDRLCYERHLEGEKKYGAGTWLGIDTIQHAMDEILDFGNYAKFTYIKLAMFRDGVADLQLDGSIAKAQPDYDGFLVGKTTVTQTKGIPTL